MNAKYNKRFVVILSSLSLSLALTGCAGLSFLSGLGGQETPASTQEEKAAEAIGKGTKEVVEAFPGGKIVTGIAALVALAIALKKKEA